MTKEKHKIGIYMRFGNEIYTSVEELHRDVQRGKAMKSMTSKQIEICNKMQEELETGDYELKGF